MSDWHRVRRLTLLERLKENKRQSETQKQYSDVSETKKTRSLFRRKLYLKKKFRLGAAETIIIGFLVLILFGACLLMLPIASQSRTFTSPRIAFFTAVSSSCVTGLTVVSTGNFWSMFGQTVILILIQIGGLGFMTLAVMLSLFAKRQITPRERMITAQSLGLNGIDGTVKLVRRILCGTFLFEGTGAAILSFQFVPVFGAKGVFYGIFHSVSFFCNAGFDLLDGLTGFHDNLWVGIPVMLLIVIGGIGFLVWDDLLNLMTKRQHISVYSKLVLTVTALLLVSGTALIAVFEWNNPDTVANLSPAEKIYQSLFQSVTTRTAGLDFIGNAAMTPSSQLVCLFYMLIGGASGSTAGGVKVGSFGIIVLAIIGFAKGNDEITFCRRKIGNAAILRALTVFSINLTAGVFGGLAVAMTDGVELLPALYETVSAISTVGLSLNLTPTLGTVSDCIIMMLMFFGRVGILTITYSLMLRQAKKRSCISYPEANLLIG